MSCNGHSGYITESRMEINRWFGELIRCKDFTITCCIFRIRSDCFPSSKDHIPKIEYYFSFLSLITFCDHFIVWEVVNFNVNVFLVCKSFYYAAVNKWPG